MTTAATTETRERCAAGSSSVPLWRRPVVWLAVAAAVVVLISLNWTWLFAASALSKLIGVGLCAAMCSFHLCGPRRLRALSGKAVQYLSPVLTIFRFRSAQ